MKIALVYPKFDRSGGEEVYASDLAAGLAAREHSVHMLGRRVSGVPAGARFQRLRTLRYPRWLKTWSFCRVADRAAVGLSVDVVQGFGKTTCQTVHHPGGGVHRGYLERKGQTELGFYDRVAVGIEDRLYAAPHLRAVICPSHWVAGEVRRYYPGLESRLHVIPNGVDIDGFAPAGRVADREHLGKRLQIGDDTPILLFVAHNFRLKGLDLAVEALSRVPRAHLAVVGGGKPDAFEALALSLGVRDRVHFLGPQPDLPPLYRAADVLVHPTRYDPFGNVCVEALACGTPLVTTENAGAVDGLGTCPAVAIVGADCDGRAIGAAVESLLQLGDGLRREACEVSQKFAQKDHVRAVVAVYRQIVSSAGPSRLGA